MACRPGSIGRLLGAGVIAAPGLSKAGGSRAAVRGKVRAKTAR